MSTDGATATTPIKERVLIWLLNQGPVTVILLCILGSIAWLGHYALETAIPGHLESIQRGYTEVSKENRIDNDRWRAMYREMAKLPPEPANIAGP